MEQKTNKWISVNDRLPEIIDSDMGGTTDNVLILVYHSNTNDSIVSVGYLTGNVWNRCTDRTTNEIGEFSKGDIVTHWAPIPELCL